MTFWANAMSVRVAEMNLDIGQARQSLAEAVRRLDEFPHAAVLFDRPGLWSSPDDLRREALLIDAIEQLVERGDVPAAAEALRSWLRESAGDASVGQLKHARVRLRLLVVEALALALDGQSGRGKIDEARALTAAHPELANVGQKLIHLTQPPPAGPPDDLLRQVAKLVPLDKVVDSPAPAVRDVLEWMPKWYRRVLAESSPAASSARLLTVWYLRVVTDYLFSVYVDELLWHSPYNGPVPRCPDLSLARIEELTHALEGLYVAMGWKGASGRALDDLLRFCKAAQDADDDEMLLAHLFATMQSTERWLYPTPLFLEAGATGWRPVTARSFVGQDTKTVHPATVRLPEEAFFYIKPKFKARPVVRQDSRTAQGSKPLHIYEARVFGIPRPVTLLCEGDTDQATLTAVLQALDPTWAQLDLSLRVGEGDTLPYIYRYGCDPENVVVMVDNDKLGLSRGDWGRVWDCCHAIRAGARPGARGHGRPRSGVVTALRQGGHRSRARPAGSEGRHPAVTVRGDGGRRVRPGQGQGCAARRAAR